MTRYFGAAYLSAGIEIISLQLCILGKVQIYCKVLAFKPQRNEFMEGGRSIMGIV